MYAVLSRAFPSVENGREISISHSEFHTEREQLTTSLNCVIIVFPIGIIVINMHTIILRL